MCPKLQGLECLIKDFVLELNSHRSNGFFMGLEYRTTAFLG